MVDQGVHCEEAVLTTGEGLTRQVCFVAVPVHTQDSTGHLPAGNLVEIAA